ncbi:MAG: iron-siderophore ABC transporter substrate-binding protein [Cyanobacteria bacterium P01_C01_bin.72]
MRYSIKPFFLMVFSFILIVACQPTGLQQTNESQVKPTECQMVQHKLGEICMPINPQRIVALDPRHLADPLLALGIEPVGTAIYVYQGEEGLAGLTAYDIEGIEINGDAYQPSLEKIVILKPDLIFALDFAHEQIYQQLSAIAPTILMDWKKNYSFKTTLQYLAQIVDRETKADKVISQYQQRIETLQAQLDRKPEEIEVTLLVYFGGKFAISSQFHRSYEIFSDIGLSNKTAPAEGEQTISREVLDQYDADVLFIMNYEAEPESFFLENPLIASLDAVKNNRAYFVDPDKWSANGPIGVNRMLDDLFQYLPQTTK